MFRGEIATLGASDESKALGAIGLHLATRAFACDVDALRTIHERATPERTWARTCDARAALASDPAARDASIALAVSLGFERATLAVDAPRLRVVTPRMHEEPAAKRAFYMHRDTWYGSPRAQINAWLPLFDVTELDSFAIHRDAFGARIDNDSETFDYASFHASGGFQSRALAPAAYPRCTSAAPNGTTRVHARAFEVVAFSAAHLHATTPNETRFTRFSVDVRFVDFGDVERGDGAPDLDNASRGSALADYFRVTP
jgi:hypothetical protein